MGYELTTLRDPSHLGLGFFPILRTSYNFISVVVVISQLVYPKVTVKNPATVHSRLNSVTAYLTSNLKGTTSTTSFLYGSSLPLPLPPPRLPNTVKASP